MFLLVVLSMRCAWAGDRETAEGKVTLEGDWQPYQATSLSVKRTINIERDGQSHLAEVMAPVLTRRGAVFLDPDKISELLKIREEVESLRAELGKVREKARDLGQRYTRLVEDASRQIPDRKDPGTGDLGGVAFRISQNENQNEDQDRQ